MQATADCSDGLCMPCYKGLPIVERKQGPPSHADEDKDTTVMDWIKAIFWGGLVLVLVLILKPLIALVVCLSAHFLFGASWPVSLVSGVVTYLILMFVESVWDIGEGLEEIRRNKKMKTFKKRWQEEHAEE